MQETRLHTNLLRGNFDFCLYKHYTVNSHQCFSFKQGGQQGVPLHHQQDPSGGADEVQDRGPNVHRSTRTPQLLQGGFLSQILEYAKSIVFVARLLNKII